MSEAQRLARAAELVTRLALTPEWIGVMSMGAARLLSTWMRAEADTWAQGAAADNSPSSEALAFADALLASQPNWSAGEAS